MFRPGNLGHLGRMGLVAASRNAFSPLSLFAAGEQGAWYDPSDMSTLFQDSAGTTPVTAVEQPVGRILDKSGGGNHLIQPTATSRPTLKQDGNGMYHLHFDGVDDSMYSAASVDFTSTDKMTVFAGLHKAVSGVTVAVELSPNVDWSNNAFNLATDVSANSWYWSTGSNQQGQLRAFVTPAASPVTSVLSTVFDRSLLTNAQIAARMNGAAATVNYQGAASTSNFGNYPLYIGARAGTSLYFNGRLYSLIVRGAQSSLSQIEATELYMKKKVGIA